MGRLIALSFSWRSLWWSLYTRLAIPGWHTEAVTSRPLLHDTARAMTHSQRTLLTITSCHGKRQVVESCLRAVSAFLRRFWESAEELGRETGLRRPLRCIFAEFYASVRAERRCYARC